MPTHEDIEQKLIQYLTVHAEGAPALRIAKEIGHNRITVSKYLDLLHARNIVTCRTIGQAKLWTLQQNNTKYKVLVVDDEEPVVNIISLSLSDEDYDILKAYDGEQALSIVAKQRPDLIVLDIMMPKKDGIEVCQTIKSNILTKDCQVILLSAKTQVEDKVRGFNAGADYYMEKPFDPLELSAVIQAKLKSKEHEKSKHPITKLDLVSPSQPRLRAIAENEQYVMGVVTITGFNDFVESTGFKQGAYILQMIGKLISSELEKMENIDSYVGMMADDQFLIAIKGSFESFFEKLSKEYEGSLPFLDSTVGGTVCSQKLQMKFKKGTLDELMQD